MKRNKLLTLWLIFTVFVLSVDTNVFAHSSSQEGILLKSYNTGKEQSYIGGEAVGWFIDEAYHTNGTTITYRFDSSDPYLTDTYKYYVRQGASKWSGIATISERSDGTGLVKTFYEPNTSTYAQCTAYITDNSGHFTYWEMQLNRTKTQNITICAHEFGHTIGLKDLYNEALNKNKLMYGYNGRTVSSPTSSDIWGAKVISGQHTSHSWGYRFYDLTPSGNRHVKYCTSCNGMAVISSCTYNTNNICRICGTPKNQGTNSVIPEIN